MGSTRSAKTDTFDAVSLELTGVIAAMKLKLAATRALPIGGATVTAAKVMADFQSFVTNNTAVDKAKADLATQVASRLTQKKAVKAELADFTKWAVLQFGTAAYAMFALTAPKPKKASVVNAAIGVSKRQEKAKAKAAQKAPAASNATAAPAAEGATAPVAK